MESKRDLTRELLADCFKSLMLTTPFEKITIKMITDRAGLIRPTFYKHFQDKYEVLEWIFVTEIIDPVRLLLQNHMEREAIVMFCKCLEKDKKFYRRAYTVDGPNSFDNLMQRYVSSLILKYIELHPLCKVGAPPAATEDFAAAYYTYGLINIIREWIIKDMSCSAEELADTHSYFLRAAAAAFSRDEVPKSDARR
ncbi:MAG: TetR/AcrR family transcriptional regulator C-terminal domain-containing protein [Lachnospiraceae bacterium]|nr:TetR/AcrR family transcriptional regulator C-terminal domain-containing protein [Lachnospiraceae bacterium]